MKNTLMAIPISKRIVLFKRRTVRSAIVFENVQDSIHAGITHFEFSQQVKLFELSLNRFCLEISLLT